MPSTQCSYRSICRHILVLTGLLLAMLSIHLPGFAQSVQGAIVGTVRDASGSVVPGATVTLTNTDEGEVRTTKTNSNGDYQFVDVKAAHFTIEIAAPGFEKWAETGVEFTARQELRIDAKLAPGSVQQSVVVSGNNVSTIETETPEISAKFDSNDVLDLPVNFRASSAGTSAIGLVAALPNVDYAQPYSTWTSVNLAGSLTDQTAFDADGVTIQAITGNHPLGDLLPAADAISEIRADGVLTDAEHTAPGEITFTTKAGTDYLHGAAWWYHQETALNATPYGATSKPHVVGNTFGGRLAGPVIIPHIYDGHHRTFFWADYEGFRFPQTSPEEYNVPTPAMLQGDFTNYIIPDQNGNNTFQGLVNPSTGKVCGYTFAACGFSINSASKAFLQFYPAPNHSATANLANGSKLGVDTSHYVPGQTPNYWKNFNTSENSDQFDVRGDQYFGSNQKFLLWGRIVWKNFPSISTQGLPFFQGDTNYTSSRNIIVSANYTINPNVINEFRLGWARYLYGFSNPFNGIAFTNSLGLQGLQDLWQNNIPAISLDSSGIDGVSADRFNKHDDNKTLIISDSLSWVKGKHILKFGGGRTWQKGVVPTQLSSGDQFGQFDFGGSIQFTGVDFADFLLGLPNQTIYGVVPADGEWVVSTWAFFAQDQWAIKPRLTLSYGLRYELNPGWHEIHGLMGNFDTSVPQTGRFIYPTGKQQFLNQPWLAGANACDPDGVNNTNSASVNGVGCTPVISNSQAGLPSGLRPTVKDRLMPRVGFAYRLTSDNRWVIRGGYGIYNNYLSGSSSEGMGNLLQAGTTTYTNGYVSGDSGKPLYQWPVIYAGAGNENVPKPGSGNIGGVEVDGWRDPYTEQWTLSVDHDFGAGYGARLSYIGSASHHLEWRPDSNYLPFSSTTPAYSMPTSARRFPNLGKISVLETGANMNYNALQLEFTHRFQRGLSFDSAFTWAKELSDNGGATGGQPEEAGGGTTTTILDRHLDYGIVAGTHGRGWKTTALYSLPVGRGRRFGAGMPRALDLIAGGWDLSNIFEWDSGTHFTANYGTGGDPSGTGSGICSTAAGWVPSCISQRPDRVSGQSVKASHQSAQQWLNPNAFGCPGDPNWAPGYACSTGNAPGVKTSYNGRTYTGMELVNGTLFPIPGPIGRFGNTPVGSLLGPGYISLNSGLFKTFSLSDRFKLRAEGTFTNVLNHTNYSGSSMTTSVSSRSYGYISSALGSRNGEIGLRLDF